MVSESNAPRRPILTLDDLARPLTRRPERLHALTSAELAVAFSQALDLGEGKPAGHAQRVCYIAVSLADAVGLSAEQRSAVYFAALLHDAGVTEAAAELCRVSGADEGTIFGPSPLQPRDDQRGELVIADRTAISECMHEHTVLGAEIVRRLDLGDAAAQAVAAHHEAWNGDGFPRGEKGDDIPVEARVVSAADVAEVVIAEQTNSLMARRYFQSTISQHAGQQLEPGLASALLELAKSDAFWLGLYSDDLPATLDALRPPVDTRRSRRRLTRFAEVFADIADAKGGHTAGHSRRTAEAAKKLAEAVGLDEATVELLTVAALLHDVGLLGVPARIMSKPDILSVTEMQIVRQHPANSEMVLSALTGFEEVAQWVARHHERPDGRGYPEMLSGDEIPLEARVLAVADVYAGVTSERPHRGAMSDDDARELLLSAAGTQLDAELVRTFVSLL